ncbi:MAG: 4-(cytidine 5'-diphospho)-2-C-methyl-D-erythritol kinase [Clostridiales bacterium]|nr:4-(cytidine 5'-diphospho)-2-C-methyl-D-erythritol kinase [Clostridiales bacterium]
MKVKAYAKLNLMLDIIKKLDNGYHSLFMLMQSVGIYDIVTVEKSKGKSIKVKSDINIVDDVKKNIAYKCAKAFFDYTRIKDCGADIYIEKKIPMAAGIAGGSADGAAVIYCLDKLYGTGLSRAELCEIGSKVGADIPFSLTGGTAVVMNTGDIIAPVKRPGDCVFVMVKPEMDVSTPNAYKLMDELDRIRHLNRIEMLSALSRSDYKAVCSYCGNVFEQGVEVPDRPHIKSIMRKSGADACLMSGSGPTVFAVFSDTDKANKCYDVLSKQYKNTYICSPVDCGIEEI